MIRKEQINKAAGNYTDNRNNYYTEWEGYSDIELVEKAFIEGAKWADEHLKEGLVSIDEVCEWIEDNIFDFPWYDWDKTMSVKDITNELRKTMKERMK